MTAQADYKTRDPFFDDRDPKLERIESASDRWIEALKLANSVDQRLPGIMIDLAGGLTQEEAARRAKVTQQSVAHLLRKLRTSHNAARSYNLN